MKFNEHHFPAKPNPNWKQQAKAFFDLKPITLDDVKNGTNNIVRISHHEFFNPRLENKCVSQTLKNGVFSFGKYKGQTIKWVERYDPRYLDWCRENVAGFEY